MATATKESHTSTAAGRNFHGPTSYQGGLSPGYKTAKPPKMTGARAIPRSPIASPTYVAPPNQDKHQKITGNPHVLGRVVILRATAHWSGYLSVDRMDEPAAKTPSLPLSPIALSPAQAPMEIKAKEAVTKNSQLRSYLRRVSMGDRALITPETANRALKAWHVLWAASGYSMAAPASCTGPDGEMFYSWDRGKHHLELEIIPGAPAEFFYRDRETEQFWGEDYEIGKDIPASIVDMLSMFR